MIIRHTRIPEEFLCPDLTKEQVEWFEKHYTCPIWDGRPESAAQYQRDVGQYYIAQMLRQQYDQGPDPMADGELAR